MSRRSVLPGVVGVLAAALVGLLVYGVVRGGDDTTLDDAVKNGKRPTAPAVDMRRPLLDGSGERALADLKGKVVVLNFWASWCTPCKAEAPLLERAQTELARSGQGTVLGATFQDDPQDSKDFETAAQVTYPSVRDLDTNLAQEYGTRSLPETFVLDRDGRIVAISRGQVTQGFLDRAIAKAQTSGGQS